jgi:hypothetical protein
MESERAMSWRFVQMSATDKKKRKMETKSAVRMILPRDLLTAEFYHKHGRGIIHILAILWSETAEARTRERPS